MDIKQFLNKTLLITKHSGYQILVPWGTYMVEYIKDDGAEWIEITAPDEAQYSLSQGKWTDEDGSKIDVELL